MTANLIDSYLIENTFILAILSVTAIFFSGKITYFTAYIFNILHWKSILFPFPIFIFNKFFHFLRVAADKIPFITLSIVLAEKLNLSLFWTGLFTIFAGVLRLASTYDWRNILPKIKRWRFELGIYYEPLNKGMEFGDKNFRLSLLSHLAKPNHLNKFDISKTDFRCYIALALLFFSLHFFPHGGSYPKLEIIALILIMWCCLDALKWNLKLHHKADAYTEKYQESIKLFFGIFYQRTLFFVFLIFILYFFSINPSLNFSRYHIAAMIFFSIFLNKFLRIWNEALLTKQNLQKEYYPASYHREHMFKFENARIWRDIGAQKGEAVNPLVRLVMFRTMFELSERSFFLGIINHLDIISAIFFYAVLIS